jgi:hypothetical protein
LAVGYFVGSGKNGSNIEVPRATVTPQEITSFEDCVKAGYPVMESYPRQCRTPDGRNFTEQIKPTSEGEQKCGIENCHGLDISCGPNVPDFCTFIYKLGDGCRRYARCQVINGRCQLVKDKKFDQCKSCVEKCWQDFKDETIKMSQCESGCFD